MPNTCKVRPARGTSGGCREPWGEEEDIAILTDREQQTPAGKVRAVRGWLGRPQSGLRLAEVEERICREPKGLRQYAPEQLRARGLVRKCLSPVAPTSQGPP